MTKMTTRSGRFIVFEGVEGVGKSTQVDLLESWLKSQVNVLKTREPGGTPLAEDLRHLVLRPSDEPVCAETELLIMMAARLQHWNQCIKPAIQKGCWVVCDRFVDSSVAYQGAGRGLSEDLVRQMHHMIAPEMKPDLVIVLDMDVSASRDRMELRGLAKDRMEQSSDEFFVKARAAFLASARLRPSHYLVVDATQSIEHVHDQIKVTLRQRFLDQEF